MTDADRIRELEAQVHQLNAKLDDTHMCRCFNCERTVTEATATRQLAATSRLRSEVRRETIEECAKVADGMAERHHQLIHPVAGGAAGSISVNDLHLMSADVAKYVAKDIRALADTKEDK